MKELTVVKVVNKNKDFFGKMMFDIIPKTNSILLGVVCDGCACGIAEVSQEGNTARIEHFYIANGYRRQKIGSYLLDYIIDYLEESANKIYASYCEDEENVSQFLSMHGFFRSFRADAYRTSYSIPAVLKTNDSIPLERIDTYRLSNQLNYISVQAQQFLKDHGYKAEILNSSGCNKQYSFILSENKQVKGVMINSMHQGDLYIDYIAANDPKSVYLLIRLLCNSLVYDKVVPKDIIFLAVNPKVLPLMHHMFPDKEMKKEFAVYDAIFEY